MQKYMLPAAISAALTCVPAVAKAQGYNTFVVEVPYEISLPSTVKKAFFRCDFQVQPIRAMVVTKTIDLVNGQASGSLKVGYDLNGSEPNLTPISTNEGLVADFRKLTTSPDFSMDVLCEVKLASSTGANDYLFEENGVYILQNPANLDRVLLEGQTNPTLLNAVLSHSDNLAPQAKNTATTVVPAGRAASGLQGSESVAVPNSTGTSTRLEDAVQGQTEKLLDPLRQILGN